MARLPAIDHIAAPKFHQYVLEARALDAADIKATKLAKRYALAVVLIHAQLRQALDDAVDILRRKVRNSMPRAPNSWSAISPNTACGRKSSSPRCATCSRPSRRAPPDAERGGRIASAIEGESAQLRRKSRHQHMAYAADNYFPFMMASYQAQRPLLLNCLGLLELASTHSDQTLVQAIAFVLQHRSSHKEHLPVDEAALGLQWLPEQMAATRRPGKRARQAFQRSPQVF